MALPVIIPVLTGLVRVEVVVAVALKGKVRVPVKMEVVDAVLDPGEVPTTVLVVVAVLVEVAVAVVAPVLIAPPTSVVPPALVAPP